VCGIGGILSIDGGPVPDERADAIDRRIAHRGPDGAGRFRDRVTAGGRVVEIVLIHRRMSIIDPGGGAQPMVSEHGRTTDEGLVAVVFNGCIYNHRELRRTLEAAGHRFVTDHSDTEVLLHGHREWGEQLPLHLEGMYACAIWDRRSATLSLARDRFGEKPLYYRRKLEDGAGTFTFSSSRAAVADARAELDAGADEHREWMRHYLARGCGWGPWPGGDGTTRLQPGIRLDVGPNGSTIGTGNCALARPDAPVTTDDIEPLLDRAVERRLEADVPLGCFLSGGVDSSLIAHFARRHVADLRTFSVRMPDPRYDESGFAADVAAHLGTRHTTLDVDARPAEDLTTLVAQIGQPFGDSSILPTHWVSRAARDHVRVALAGDGGDEMFVGYERYLAAPHLARHWWWLRAMPPVVGRGAHPKSLRNKLARLGSMARDYRLLGVDAMGSIFDQRQIDALLGSHGPRAHESIQAGPVPDAMADLRLHDVAGYLPDDLLTKVDTASMAVALEVRCPFLDRDLAAAALALPTPALLPHGRRKGLLREIARRHLPQRIVDRPKMGFAIPVGEWFRDDTGGMKTLLLDHLHSAEPFGPIDLDAAAVNRLLDEHMRGARDHGQRLFTLLTLSMWATA